MAVHDIGYVELYTRDKVSAVNHLVSAMGFTRVADSVEAERSSVLLQQGRVRLVVTSGRGVVRFLEQHGDGIADIALTCDDVAQTAAAAAAAGATVTHGPSGRPVVSGFGDVTHTLLPGGAATNALPEDRTWVPNSAAAPAAAGRITDLDHVAVCLEGGALERYADFYRDAFGLSRYSSEYVAVGGQAMDSIVVRSASGGVILTLVAPDPALDPGQLDAFLDRNGGEGVQHLAFLTDRIVPAVHELRERGVTFLDTPDSYYDALGERLPGLQTEIEALRDARVLADRDEWGDLLQLFTRSPYPRNTLFFELIQRNGSRGFGSANIRALYEAVERDRLIAG
ncbi:4-hydroxyphenylpyruvate dioxygenase [Kitasatospora sp. CB01950]|uniref:4-hydroxyphenylpyruvate dioxygenase n=1 Tax=Kitasatospora sp. CB01950 TaxID=1703930 RepID=UPI0009390E28|nr:4-hydroxyphenylpyruvate dioxygenase [Kitasatospora sp. CB01950]OKI92978.1 4-hydroxyphenylpyruvate dioxygenase [Kitasatospora sp. CB01950]